MCYYIFYASSKDQRTQLYSVPAFRKELISMDENILKKLAKPLIVLATLIWGTSFVIMKNTLDAVPPFYLLAFRFLVAAAFLSIIFSRKMRKINREYLKCGGIMGTVLFTAYIAQTYGLKGTSPGNNAFLTAAYCIIVPFLAWFTEKKRPDLYNMMAAFLCLAGIGLVSLSNELKVNQGDALTLLGGLFYSVHIIVVNHFAKDRDIFILTIVQFFVSGILSLLCAFIFNTPPAALQHGAMLSLLYLSFGATAAALLFQNIGQKYTEPAAASLLLALEAPLGVFFSILFYSERPTVRVILGFVLIFAAVIFSETKLDFLRKSTRGEKRESTAE